MASSSPCNWATQKHTLTSAGAQTVYFPLAQRCQVRLLGLRVCRAPSHSVPLLRCYSPVQTRTRRAHAPLHTRTADQLFVPCPLCPRPPPPQCPPSCSARTHLPLRSLLLPPRPRPHHKSKSCRQRLPSASHACARLSSLLAASPRRLSSLSLLLLHSLLLHSLRLHCLLELASNKPPSVYRTADARALHTSSRKRQKLTPSPSSSHRRHEAFAPVTKRIPSLSHTHAPPPPPAAARHAAAAAAASPPSAPAPPSTPPAPLTPSPGSSAWRSAGAVRRAAGWGWTAGS